MAILIRGGQVLEATQASVTSADVLVEGDRITAVGAGLAAPAGATIIDATGHFILPGLLNAHTHAHNHLVRGFSDNWTLEDLNNYRLFLYTSRTAEEQYVSAALGAVEMLKTGCTAAYDLFMAVPASTGEGVEAVVRAYADVGLRAVVAPAVGDVLFYQTVPGLLDLLPHDLRATVESMESAPADGLLRLTEDAIRRWDRFADGRVRIAVAPSIPGQCSDEFLVGCGRLAREHGVGLHTHLVESKVQAVSAVERWGKTLVAALADLDVLGPNFVGAHAVWLTDDDMRMLADTGSAIAHNPASNLKLGSGIAPIRELLDQGVNVGLGTDGTLSSDNLDMFEAMRFGALVSKVRFGHQQERWIGAAEAWQMATTGSARLMGMADDVGAIAPGRKADIVLLQAGGVFVRPLNHALNALVYAETGANVATVLVDGRVVLANGRVLTVDERRLAERAQEAADRLRGVNAQAWTLCEQITPYLKAACRAAVAEPFPVNRYAGPVG